MHASEQTPDLDDYKPLFTSAETAAAADVTPSTLKNWVSRQPQVVFLLIDERERVGRGYPILFSFVRVMQIALVAKLTRHGYAPRQAAMIAAAFTDTGGFGGAGDPGAKGEARDPGQLFKDGATLLVATPDSDQGRIVRVPSCTLSAPLTDLLFDQGVWQTDATMIDVSRLYRHVRASLGL